MESFCCEKMMAALSFDGPFWKDRHGYGVAVYKLTKSRKAISMATGSRRYEPIQFCPWCGVRLEADNET